MKMGLMCQEELDRKIWCAVSVVIECVYCVGQSSG
jgi:hypothetical protein